MPENAPRRVSLIDAFGRGATHGTLWWYGRVGNRTAFIQLLGKGEMDGVDKAYYGAGFEIPEFDQSGNRNWKFWSSDAGVNTGPPTLIPQLSNFIKQGMTWVEVLLPADLSEGEGEPDQMIWYLRCLRVHNYTVDGGGNLVQGAKIFSANNALVALFIATQRMKLAVPRFHASWISDFLPRCDGALNYDAQTGLLGTYYSGVAFNTLVRTRNDPQIDFNWTDMAPTPFLPSTNYSVRWTGIVTPEFSETYTFYTFFDDGARLWVNGVQLVNNFAVGPPRENSGTIALTAGQAYSITVEYFQQTEAARIALSWSSSSQPKQIVPQSRLAPGVSSSGRFSAHVAFPANTPAADAFESVMRLAPGCDWQDVSGKIKVLTVPNRGVTHKFVYDNEQTALPANIVSGSFSLQPRPLLSRPNFFSFTYLDLDDPFYSERFVEVDRPALRALQGGRLIPVGPIPLGLMTRSQATRMANSEAKVASDLPLVATLSGFPDSHRVAKGDVVETSHEVPGWAEAAPPKFMVTEENFPSSTSSGGDRRFTLRLHSDAYYSDTDHQPLEVRVTSDLPSPFVKPPPVVSIVLGQSATLQPDGTFTYNIAGNVLVNPAHPYPQRVRVYWKQDGEADSAYRVVMSDFVPSAAGVASFEIPNIGIGVFHVKCIAISSIGLGIALTAAVAQSVTIANQQLPPVTLLTGVRGTADRTLISEWVGQPQLTPFAERYEVEIMRATTPFDVVRTFRNVSPANTQSEAVIWYVFSGTDYTGFVTIFADGSVDFNDFFSRTAWLKSKTMISPRGGLYFEYTVPTLPTQMPEYVAIHPIAGQFNATGNGGSFYWYHNELMASNQARPTGPPGTVPTFNTSNGDRLGIELTPDGRVRYYINRTNEASVPVYESPYQSDQISLYTASLRTGGITSAMRAGKCRFIRHGPEIIYTEEMQKNDFGGTAPASVTVRVYQMSPAVLNVRGLAAQATFP